MFSIYDIIKEAEDDNADAGQATAEAPADDSSADTSADDAGGDDAANDDAGGDDEFDMDASLDDVGGDEGNDDDGGGDDLGGDTGGASDTADGDEEVVDTNTNIFDSLTAEEQRIKIGELKNQYRDLYTSISEILNRLTDFSTDETNYQVINRVTDVLQELKRFIGDYFIYTFPHKSFMENDIKFNELLFAVTKIRGILDKFVKEKEANKDES